jgi:hypothetical protein
MWQPPTRRSKAHRPVRGTPCTAYWAVGLGEITNEGRKAGAAGRGCGCGAATTNLLKLCRELHRTTLPIKRKLWRLQWRAWLVTITERRAVLLGAGARRDAERGIVHGKAGDCIHKQES